MFFECGNEGFELSKAHHQDGKIGVSSDICGLDYIDSQAWEIISHY